MTSGFNWDTKPTTVSALMHMATRKFFCWIHGKQVHGRNMSHVLWEVVPSARSCASLWRWCEATQLVSHDPSSGKKLGYDTFATRSKNNDHSVWRSSAVNPLKCSGSNSYILKYSTPSRSNLRFLFRTFGYCGAQGWAPECPNVRN